jgi:hypothetical protein
MWGKLLLRPHYNIKSRVSMSFRLVLPQTMPGAVTEEILFKTQFIQQGSAQVFLSGVFSSE